MSLNSKFSFITKGELIIKSDIYSAYGFSLLRAFNIQIITYLLIIPLIESALLLLQHEFYQG